ncbi:MAG: fumarylacetoacetate (FAA) hydrolase [Hyphomonadaceae bacterium]|nr:MAG: fumarylacetoacetate (FAA) hydrolase [Hyphomonadaceae bacterium]
MKLASLKSGRDGRLVVVSNDLNYYTDAGLIAPTLQAALDDWEHCEPLLRGLFESLEHGSARRNHA